MRLYILMNNGTKCFGVLQPGQDEPEAEGITIRTDSNLPRYYKINTS